MKKKLLTLGLAALCLTGCGNHDIGFGNYTFDYCHIQMAGSNIEASVHYKIDSWKDDGEGSAWELKIVLPSGEKQSISVSSMSVICFAGDYCPICQKKIA